MSRIGLMSVKNENHHLVEKTADIRELNFPINTIIFW
tara:strand:+ start:238 stop:348 length:111 start_codon:yes stop_codon:yes gene_type:complete